MVSLLSKSCSREENLFLCGMSFPFCVMKNFVPLYYFLLVVLFLSIILFFISYFYFVFVYGSTSLCGSTTGHSILCSFIWYCSKYDSYLYLKSPLYFCVVVRRKRWDSNSGDCGGKHSGLPLGHFRWG